MGPQAHAERAMSGHLRTIPDDAGILTATKSIRDCEVRRLPIVDRAGYLVGIVTLDDLLGVLGRELYNLTEGIRHEVEVK
jgi:CBS-domain-containing membrane protein